MKEQTMKQKAKINDDEGIRGAIIEHLIDNNLTEWASWLEKQNPNVNKEYWRGYREGKQEILDKYVELGKQGEQKSTNKIELKSKFKVGDWVVSPNGVYWHIYAIRDGRYQVCSDSGEIADWPLDTNIYHKFTIQDAKDGDVLAFDNNTMVIFKDLYNKTTFHSYCHIEDGVFSVSEEGVPDWWNGEGFTPATKEQRDLLFQKMKEVGYEWDADKKEVKRVYVYEEVNAEDYGIDALYHAQRILEKTLGKVDGYQTDDGILDHKAAITTIKKLYEQKPIAWSEGDEQNLNSVLSYINDEYLRRWLKDTIHRYEEHLNEE